MICLTDKLPRVMAESVALARIKCTFAAYGNYPKIALFWVQTNEDGRVTAIISLMERTLNLYAENLNEELELFVKSQDFDLVFADKEIAEGLNLKGETFCALKAVTNGEKGNKNDINSREIYEIFKEDFSLNQLEFIADLSHRLRHDCAFCVKSESGAAVVQTAENLCLITGIAVDKTVRKKGEGSKILNEIKQNFKGEIFVYCKMEVLPFYLKNSFEKIGFCVLGRI